MRCQQPKRNSSASSSVFPTGHVRAICRPVIWCISRTETGPAASLTVLGRLTRRAQAPPCGRRLLRCASRSRMKNGTVQRKCRFCRGRCRRCDDKEVADRNRCDGQELSFVPASSNARQKACSRYAVRHSPSRIRTTRRYGMEVWSPRRQLYDTPVRVLSRATPPVSIVSIRCRNDRTPPGCING